MGEKPSSDKRRPAPRRNSVAAVFSTAYNRGMNFTVLFSLVAGLLVLPLRPAFCAETNHNFAKWESDMAAFEAHDRTNAPPTNALLFIGSSTIRLWTTLAADFPGHAVINRGFGGSEVVDSTHFAGRILFPYAPKAIFFRAGGNDIAAGRAPELVFEDFKDFVATVHAKLPDIDIYFISWNPTIARWPNRDKEAVYNNAVKAFAQQTTHLIYIETADMVLGPDGRPRPELFRADKLHFSAAGYKLLVARVRPFLPK
jgi:lysophospholipase L1-like esterase